LEVARERADRNRTGNIMAKLSTDELLDTFKEMTLLELSEFVKQFEETFDVKAAAPVAVAAAGAAPGAPAEEAEVKDEFDVILEGAGDKKIQVIKEVRALTSLGRRRAQAAAREGQQGDGRQGQGGPGEGRRLGDGQVVVCFIALHGGRSPGRVTALSRWRSALFPSRLLDR
jgi:large subunit ribosomal protein L7/L12